MDKNSFLDYLKVLKLNEAFPDYQIRAGGFRVDPIDLESSVVSNPLARYVHEDVDEQNKADA